MYIFNLECRGSIFGSATNFVQYQLARPTHAFIVIYTNSKNALKSGYLLSTYFFILYQERPVVICPAHIRPQVDL